MFKISEKRKKEVLEESFAACTIEELYFKLMSIISDYLKRPQTTSYTRSSGSPEDPGWTSTSPVGYIFYTFSRIPEGVDYNEIIGILECLKQELYTQAVNNALK